MAARLRTRIERAQAALGRVLDPARLTASPEMRFLGRTLFLASLVGLTCGIVGLVFVRATDFVERLLIEQVAGVNLLRAAGERVSVTHARTTFPFALLIIPAIGAGLAGLLIKYVPEAGGGGVDATLRAYHEGDARIRRRVAFAKLIASALTLGSGGSGGREGPTMQIGASIGAGLGRALDLDERERRLLFIAGIAAGIAAVFHTPLGAALFAVEVLYKEGFESDALVPAVLASVFGYSVPVLFYGEHTLFLFPRSLHFVPLQLPLYIGLGVLCAAFARLLISVMRRSQRFFGALQVPVFLRPALGGLGMGVVASLAIFTASRVFDFGFTGLGLVGSGYGMLQGIFSQASWLPDGLAGVAFFLALALLKIACTALTVGSGGSAGDFAPSLVIGGVLGAAFAVAAGLVFPSLAIEPAAFALVGMAALFSGAAHVPLAGLVLACELAGSYALLVPSMLTIGVTSILLRKATLYEGQRHSVLAGRPGSGLGPASGSWPTHPAAASDSASSPLIRSAPDAMPVQPRDNKSSAERTASEGRMTDTIHKREIHKRDPMVKVQGRVLYLSEDLELLEKQLAGEIVTFDPERKLIDNISTDELTPGWVCFWYDETLGDYCLVGLRGNKVQKDSIKGSKPGVIVSGLSKGCGSSRETAPYSEKVAGVQVVVAKTIEKIYGQNCRNIGLLTTTDFSVLERLERGESIPLAEFTKGLNPIETGIVEYGGLFGYNKARLAGEVSPPAIATAKRPLNLVEKIIASRAIADAKTQKVGVPFVQPGDALFCRADVRFSHDYTTAMCESLFTAGYGKGARIRDVSSVFAFRDHLTFRNKIMTEPEKKKGLHVLVDNLASVQEAFCNAQGIRLFGEVTNERGEVGSEAICHNAVMEELGGPGDIIVGTDSHTCTAGALGAFAFGVGSTDMANAWYTADIQVKVPASVKYVLTGKPKPGVTAKDIMLFVMAQKYSKDGGCIGKVMEFSGPGLLQMPLSQMDERATLTNLAVECGATTGIIEADDVTKQYLMKFRGWSEERASTGYLKADADAQYDATFTIDLADVPQMVATPGDPRNGVGVDALPGALGKDVVVEIAYGGSCTGGKMADMDMYAEVLGEGLKRGMRVKPDVKMYIQFGSQRIKRYAEEKGYLKLFADAGAEVIEPSCGACINAGPGVSRTREQVTVSAINRNFPGRSGPGQVYLASPRVVAASALKGTIVTPEQLFQ